MMKIEGFASESGSISQRNGSADPDPHQNVMDPQHCPVLMDPDPEGPETYRSGSATLVAVRAHVIWFYFDRNTSERSGEATVRLLLKFSSSSKVRTKDRSVPYVRFPVAGTVLESLGEASRDYTVFPIGVADLGCLTRIRIFSIPDFSILTQKMVSKLSEIRSGLFIPDPDHDF
jgi:hypothetical protein